MSSMRKFVAVILAGGKGQRFWPLSTSDKPKQFLDLTQCGRTLIQATFDRILSLTGGPETILVATAGEYEALVRAQLPELPENNLLIEPVSRDSAPAIALTSLELRQRYGDVTTGFFPSDHSIGQPNKFRRTLQNAINLSEKENSLITIGINPTRPATGYGYIEKGLPSGPGFRIKGFFEKPDLNDAKTYLATNRYIWNSGIFVWPVDTILEELDRHAPELMTPLRRAFKQKRVAEIFPNLKKISIDHAVMEHTNKAYVIPSEFEWDDIGDWLALERLFKQNDPEDNTVLGRHIGFETSRSVIYSENPDDVIVTLGVNDLIVIKRGNAVQVMNKEHEQDIKEIINDALVT